MTSLVARSIAAAALIALLPAAPARALECGPSLLSEMVTHADGDVMILAPWLSNWTYICNLAGTWKDIPGQTCWAWFSQASAAIVDGREVGIDYGSISGTCSTLATFENAPAPAYLRFTIP